MEYFVSISLLENTVDKLILDASKWNFCFNEIFQKNKGRIEYLKFIFLIYFFFIQIENDVTSIEKYIFFN